MHRFSLGLLWVVVSVAVAVPTAHADVIVPGTAAGVEGNANNAFPFNLTSFGFSSERYQQVYSAAEFGGGSVFISGITFRRIGPLEVRSRQPYQVFRFPFQRRTQASMG